MFPLTDNLLYIAGVRERARAVVADSNATAMSFFDRKTILERCDGTTAIGGDGPERAAQARDARTPSESVIVLERLVQMDAWLREYAVELV